MEIVPTPNRRARYPHQAAPVSQRCNTTVPTFSASGPFWPAAANRTQRLAPRHSKLAEDVRDVDTGSTRPGDVFRGLLRLARHRPGGNTKLIGQVVAVQAELQLLARLEADARIQGGESTQVPEVRRVSIR